MIFRVPKEFEGSFILNSLNMVLTAGRTIELGGNKIYAPDVRAAIKKGILIPDEHYNKKNVDVNENVTVVNVDNGSSP